MRLKVVFGGVEQTFDGVGSAIGVKKLENLVKALKEVPVYDESTGAGDRYEFSGYSLVFVKDELSGRIAPFIIKPGRTNPLLVTDVTMVGDAISFETNQKDGISVDVKFDAAVQTIVEKAKERFDKEYDTPEKKKELQLLYLANTKNGGNPAINPYADEYQSHIKFVVPVKKADSTEATLVVVRDDKDVAQVYYVPSKVGRESTLVDEAGLVALGAELVHGIIENTTDAMKATIKLDSGDIEVSSTAVSGNSVINELNQFETALGSDLVRIASETAPVSKLIYGGINVKHFEKVGKTKTPVDGCLLVASHAENASNAALYRVIGKTYEDFQAIGLSSHDELMALVKRSNYGTAEFTENKTDGTASVNGKDVSGVTVTGAEGYYALTNNEGQVIVRTVPHRETWLGKAVKNYWAVRQQKGLVITDPAITGTSLVRTKLNEISNGPGATNGIGTATEMSIGQVKTKVAVKWVTTIVAVTLAATMIGVTADAVAKRNELDKSTPTDVAAQTYNADAERNAKALALANLQDETDQAITYGKLAAEENAKDIGAIIGQQFADGSWDSKVGTLLDAEYAPYTQQNGLTYNVELMNNDGKTYRTEARTLEQKDVEDYGKTYVYNEEGAVGYFGKSGELAAQSALDAGKQSVKTSGGQVEVIVTYADGSEEAMIKKYGEVLTKAYVDGYVSHIEMQLEKGNIGANAIADAREFFMTDEGQEIVEAIAGENAEVLAVKGGVAYFRSEDKSVVHRVEFEFNIDGVDGNYVFVADNKPFFRASDAFENVFPGKDASKYADTYVALNARTEKGKTTAETETLTIVAGGDVKEEKTSVVTASSDKFDGDLATVYAVKGGNASTIKPGYTVNAPKTEKPAETSKTGTATQGLGGK